ncbi:U32 family peptidase [Orbaceae bacterium ESL0721]|nr:U32 family peptidase [Orbaceae bacterium ESL0721]
MSPILMTPRIDKQLELLSPAKDIEIAKQAILHGADAVYIGGPSFGARHNAGNSISDIAKLAEFAHRFYVKLFVTLNTILHDNELEAAERLIWQLYQAGVDALIVQDMGILEMDLPPIELHASTQTDIRTSSKAKFLSDVGFSQIVLARELNLTQIRQIADQVDARLEFFIHGALCVAFSGQCYISHAQTGRSANRGDCSQACRLPFTLKDGEGRVVAYEKHLLSMKDNNQSNNLLQLIDAGIRSFKIEGRYKDMGYVKNITAFYRQKLDAIIEQYPEFSRVSSGKTEHFFTPNPAKNFHRNQTDYFVHGRQQNIGAFDSPKFVGLQVGEIVNISKNFLDIQLTQLSENSEKLTNGDGLTVLVKRDIVGFRADKIEKLAENLYRIFPNELPQSLLKLKLPQTVNRNLDHSWQQILQKESSKRRIAIDLVLQMSQDKIYLIANSEEGITAQIVIDNGFTLAEQPELAKQAIIENLSKLGQTIYCAHSITINNNEQSELNSIYFIPASQINQLRRDLITKLDQNRAKQYKRAERKAVSNPAPIYPDEQLSYLANVYNQKARDFYKRYGVTLIEPAYEAHQVKEDTPLMITKHCLRFAFNLCPKQAKGVQGIKATPMQLIHKNGNHGDEVLTLKFNCRACEMQVWGKIKNHILKMPLPGSDLILLQKESD